MSASSARRARRRSDHMTTPSLAVPLRLSGAVRMRTEPLKKAGPCTAVILGAGGDLMHRKLLPALYHLMHDGLLDEEFAVVGAGLEPMNDASFRAAMRQAVLDALEATEIGHVPDASWDRFAARLFYVQGDLASPALYAAVRERLTEIERSCSRDRGRLFYLALPPSVYASAVEHLAASGLAARMEDPAARPWVRVI